MSVTNMSTQVTNESNHTYFPLDSKWAKFLCFYLFYCNLKEKDPIRIKVNNKKKNLYEKWVL